MSDESMPSSIHQDHQIKRLLSRMPEEVAQRFDDEQLIYLRNAIGAREWGQHKVDFRGSFRLFKWRYYYVILIGKNRRILSQRQKHLALVLNAFMLTCLLIILFLFLMFSLYIVKSALGIDLIQNYSTGIWSWFKTVLSLTAKV